MRKALFAALLAAASPLAAQTNTSTSGSDANANSGSVSGAAAQSNPVQVQAPVNHQGNLSSVSGSDANAYSGSISGAASDQNQGQNQGQSQGQEANNSQGQSQGQEANNSQGQGQTQGQQANNSQGQSANNSQGQSANNSQSSTNNVGQMASNSQGVTVNQTWNSNQLRRTYVGTNTAVPLAASSSFSSDYCGGTASGGVSAAPIGISIGAAGPTFDESCRYLRLGEKAGMLGANYHNMGQPEMSMRAMSLMAWAVCMAGPSRRGASPTTEACLSLGLLGSPGSPVSPPPAPAPDPAVRTRQDTPTPEAVERYKVPRGDLELQHSPSPPLAAASGK